LLSVNAQLGHLLDRKEHSVSNKLVWFGDKQIGDEGVSDWLNEIDSVVDLRDCGLRELVAQDVFPNDELAQLDTGNNNRVVHHEGNPHLELCHLFEDARLR